MADRARLRAVPGARHLAARGAARTETKIPVAGAHELHRHRGLSESEVRRLLTVVGNRSVARMIAFARREGEEESTAPAEPVKEEA